MLPASFVETPRLHQAEAALPGVLGSVAIHELLQVRGDVAQLQVTAMLNLARDVLGDVFTPAVCRVEGDDLDRPAILACEQVLNDGCEVRRFQVGFAPGAAKAAGWFQPPLRPSRTLEIGWYLNRAGVLTVSRRSMAAPEPATSDTVTALLARRRAGGAAPPIPPITPAVGAESAFGTPKGKKNNEGFHLGEHR